MNLYDNKFYDNNFERNNGTAYEIMSLLISKLQPKSIVDVGCGRGLFLINAEKEGIDTLGIDGDYVERDKLLIHNFMAYDLSTTLKLEKRFDLAISFEVAEHINKESADIFVKNLVLLSDVIVFSAAIPEQGGIGHVNEQWPSYWNKKFEMMGYKGSNCLRNILWNNEYCTAIRRQNIMLYVKNDKYNDIISCFSTERELLDIVHPTIYLSLKQDNKKMKDEIETRFIDLCEFDSFLSEKGRDEFYYNIAQEMSKYSLWDMVDKLNKINLLTYQNDIYRKYLKCEELESWEEKTGSTSYIVYGAGCDGKKIVTLLNSLGKKIDMWCDKEPKENGVINCDEMYEKYDNQIIIIASRRFGSDIKMEIIMRNPNLKDKLLWK